MSVHRKHPANHSRLGSYRYCTNLLAISRWVRALNYWFNGLADFSPGSSGIEKCNQQIITFVTDLVPYRG